MSSFLDELTEKEAFNLSNSREVLADSLGLMTDFESLYVELTPLLTWPTDDARENERLAVISMAYELAFCRRQLTMGILILFRGYWGDSLGYLRRAIEGSAFAVRMSKHHELATKWLEASSGDAADYDAYRKAFRTEHVFPTKPSHADHDPILIELKEDFDFCSRMMHGSVFGLASHFTQPKPENVPLSVSFFDLPSNRELVNTYFLMLHSHRRIVRLFGKALKPYSIEGYDEWEARFNAVDAKLSFHALHWNAILKPPEEGA